MFYQNSDSTFLIVIAIMAGIVLAVMVVATIILLRSDNKKDRPAHPKEETEPTVPVEIPAALSVEEKTEDVLSSVPRVEMTVASEPKERWKDTLPSLALVEIDAVPPPKARTRIEFPLHPIVSRVLWGVCLVAAAMLFLPIVFYVMALAIGFVAVFLRAGPVSSKNLLPIAIGFLGWLGINTLLWSWLSGPNWGGDPWGLFRGFILLCVGIPALLALSLGGRWTILGVFLWVLVNGIGTLIFRALGLLAEDELFGLLTRPFLIYFFYQSS